MECSVLYFLHFLCKLFPFQSLLLLSWLLVLAFLQLFEPSHQHYTTTPLPFAASAVFSPIFIFPLSILPVFFFSSFSFTTDQQTSPSCLTFCVQYSAPEQESQLCSFKVFCYIHKSIQEGSILSLWEGTTSTCTALWEVTCCHVTQVCHYGFI